MKLSDLNWYFITVLTVILIALIIDRKRLMKQLTGLNDEYNKYWIVSQASINTILGKGIIQSLQEDNLEDIIEQIRQWNIDDPRQVQSVWGDYYEDLLTIL